MDDREKQVNEWDSKLKNKATLSPAARFHKVGRYDQLCRNVTTNLAVTMLQQT